jgi:Zn-dependent protease
LAPRKLTGLLSFAGTSVLVASAVHWFLDPGFPSRDGSLEFAIGMTLGFGVLVVNALVRRTEYTHEHHLEGKSGWTVYPGQIAVSVLCVVVSRVAHFVPGLIFGVSGDYEMRGQVEAADRARSIVSHVTTLIGIAMVAWILSVPVGHAASEPEGGFAIHVLDAALATIAVGAMEVLVFSMTPFQFLEGYHVFRWNKLVWASLWGFGVLWCALVLLNPALAHDEGAAEASVGWLLALFGFEMLVAVAFWSFFVVRNRRRPQAGDVGAEHRPVEPPVPAEFESRT